MIKLSIKNCHKLAHQHGGVCLSTEFIGNQAKYIWKCKNGHIWSGDYRSVHKGSWCLKCSGKEKFTIEKCHEVARLHGGKCLSTKYTRARDVYEWQCKHGHKWKTTLGSIIRGSWCFVCFHRSTRNTIEDCHKLAKSNNGKFLSTEYIRANIKYVWRCHEGHIFEATYCAVQKHRWCPTCGKHGKREQEIFDFVEKSLFPNLKCERGCRTLVRNPDTGYPLEIDIWISKKKIAIEINGKQHYEPATWWGSDKKKMLSDFKETKRRDLIKLRYMKRHPEITFVCIPYTISNPIEYLKSKLKKFC